MIQHAQSLVTMVADAYYHGAWWIVPAYIALFIGPHLVLIAQTYGTHAVNMHRLRAIQRKAREPEADGSSFSSGAISVWVQNCSKLLALGAYAVAGLALIACSAVLLDVYDRYNVNPRMYHVVMNTAVGISYVAIGIRTLMPGRDDPETLA